MNSSQIKGLKQRCREITFLRANVAEMKKWVNNHRALFGQQSGCRAGMPSILLPTDLFSYFKFEAMFLSEHTMCLLD